MGLADRFGRDRHLPSNDKYLMKNRMNKGISATPIMVQMMPAIFPDVPVSVVLLETLAPLFAKPLIPITISPIETKTSAI